MLLSSKYILYMSCIIIYNYNIKITAEYREKNGKFALLCKVHREWRFPGNPRLIFNILDNEKEVTRNIDDNVICSVFNERQLVLIPFLYSG